MCNLRCHVSSVMNDLRCHVSSEMSHLLQDDTCVRCKGQVTTADPGPKPAAPKHPVAVSVPQTFQVSNLLHAAKLLKLILHLEMDVYRDKFSNEVE